MLPLITPFTDPKHHSRVVVPAHLVIYNQSQLLQANEAGENVLDLGTWG